MALLSWSSEHTVLFGILNDLHEAMMKGRAQSIVGQLLHKLANYAGEHFTAEEALLQKAGYPDLAQHRILHRDLTKEVGEFVSRYERGESTLNLKLLNFLRDWLTNHIEKVDHKYGDWINEHGKR
jgi:hemerythrin-like metal-binding protein